MANFSHDLSDWLSISFDSEWLEENLRWKDFGTGVRLGRIAREDTTSLVLYVADSDVVVVSMLIRISMDKGLSTIHVTHNELLNSIKKIGIPVVGISFGSPYLPDYSVLESYMCTYGYGSVTFSAATDAFFGRSDISGILPIKLSPFDPRGHGISVKKKYQ